LRKEEVGLTEMRAGLRLFFSVWVERLAGRLGVGIAEGTDSAMGEGDAGFVGQGVDVVQRMTKEEVEGPGDRIAVAGLVGDVVEVAGMGVEWKL
jgi:hypothetical protein